MVLILLLISSSPILFFKAFVDCSKHSNYNWYHCHLYVPQLFQLSSKIQVFVYLLAFFYFYSMKLFAFHVVL